MISPTFFLNLAFSFLDNAAPHSHTSIRLHSTTQPPCWEGAAVPSQPVHHVHTNTAQEASPWRKFTGRQPAQENQLITAAAERWKLPIAASKLVTPTWLHISEGRMSMEPATASGKQQKALREQPLQMYSVQINTNKCFLASDINRDKIIHLQVQLSFTETSEVLDFFFGELQFPLGGTKSASSTTQSCS